MTTRTLTGRVALVTGGTTGIGAAITARLADLGAAVMAGRLADDGTASALAAPGRELDVFTGDLAQAAVCTEIVEACVRRFGRIDMLVNNAAVTGPAALASFLDADDEHLDRVIDVNLKAAFRCAREAARRMSRGGVIINVGSVAAYAAQQHAAAYAASKAGLLGLTRALAFELAPLGVRAVFVAPGDIATAQSPAPPEAPGEWWRRRTPLGRRGTADDVAGVIAFLCGEDAGFVSGAEILVDGGWLTY